jgi:D-arginine dehydrogenase
MRTGRWPLVIDVDVDVDEQFYFKSDAGQIMLSPADETPSGPCDAQPFAPDKAFVVGFDPQAKGFFWLAGQGGYGIQSAPGMA